MLNNYHDEPAVRAEALAMAEDMGVDPTIAATLFDLLGPNEAFDGFVTTMEDIANGYL
jgi:hypothetical protein